MTVEEDVLAAERRVELRKAFLDQPPGSQRLLILLMADPPMSYARMSAELGVPIGRIGPTRERCLQKLHRHPAISALIEA